MGKRDAEPTAVAEAEADPYYGSYGYGGYGLSYGRTYGGYGLSYGAGMAATDSPTADSTAAATTARGKLRLRLIPPSARGERTRGGLLTGAATATSPPTPGATPDPTQSPTGPTVPAATALLTTATTTERRQH